MILDEIISRTRVDLEARRSATPMAVLEERARSRPPVRSLRAALRPASRHAGRVAAIAEFKRRSPSLGWIRQAAEVADIVPRYVAAGASAISVLTDEPFFGGRLADLKRARELSSVPILRKDFVVDEYQIVEARAAGADAVLLIVAALEPHALASLFSACRAWGVEALVEAHDADEVARAVALGAEVIGINHRDLRTFKVDRELARRLRPSVPPDRVLVAESGIRDAADVTAMGRAEIDAVLVGETLMRAADPGDALRALLG